MAYSTIDDIKAHLPEAEFVMLTDDEGLGTVNQARVDAAIAQADAVIDSYMGVRYSVPVSPVPELVKRFSVDIAVHGLYSRMVMPMPEVRSERYRSAVGQMEGIASGRVSLGVPEAPEPADNGSGAETNKPTDESVFSRQSMEGF